MKPDSLKPDPDALRAAAETDCQRAAAELLLRAGLTESTVAALTGLKRSIVTEMMDRVRSEPGTVHGATLTQLLVPALYQLNATAFALTTAVNVRIAAGELDALPLVDLLHWSDRLVGTGARATAFAVAMQELTMRRQLVEDAGGHKPNVIDCPWSDASPLSGTGIRVSQGERSGATGEQSAGPRPRLAAAVAATGLLRAQEEAETPAEPTIDA